MELQTISQVSRGLGLSTRALRYYEQIGLIKSEKMDGYAYRVYSEDAVRRIRQIVILRKLRIPLKQIEEVLKSDDAATLIDAFERNLSEIDEEITALSTVREIICGFIARLNERIHGDIRMELLEDTDLLEAVDSIALRQAAVKEERAAAEPEAGAKKEHGTAELEAASETLNRLGGSDVRIIYLPPMTVAAIHAVGQDEDGKHAEETSAALLEEFIKKTDLKRRYPGARSFGFNNPDGVPDEDAAHGYERWISIPEDMEVCAPFVKKRISGGLYAARAITMGDWEEWGRLHEWVAGSETYDFRWGTVEGVCGWLEEHLNYWKWNMNYKGKVQQLDLLIPVNIKNR